MKIGVFDSGKGGTTVLEEIKKVLPDDEYLYIADTKNCPYGNKGKAELLKITSSIVEKLRDWGAKIIVVACNTATTQCIDDLRLKYPNLAIVGTEPAVKLAAESGAKRILVMATPGTIHSERLGNLVEENQKRGQTIELLPCDGLAEAIEYDGGVDKLLSELLNDVGEYDCVVLGCTHYSLIKDRIQKHFPGANVIDGNRGIAKRVLEIKKSLTIKYATISI